MTPCENMLLLTSKASHANTDWLARQPPFVGEDRDTKETKINGVGSEKKKSRSHKKSNKNLKVEKHCGFNSSSGRNRNIFRNITVTIYSQENE